MIVPLTPNTQAILLLTAPLLAGGRGKAPALLSLTEYNRLARLLREKQKQPADLIGANAGDLVAQCSELFDAARLEQLLGRGFLMAQAVDRWNTRAIWVISRADPQYPKRWKVRLKEEAPPLLYGCGECALLGKGGLAVIGSRNAEEEAIDYSRKIGKLCAESQRTVLGTAAKGISQAAMQGCWSAGGSVAGVLAESLETAALNRENREPIRSGRLVLVSPFHPANEAAPEHAAQRNKLLYALAEAALVVDSDFQKGNTWAGATEQLDDLQFVPIFVRDAGKGNAALLRRGGRSWPDPRDSDELNAVIAKGLASPHEAKQEMFPG